jgi:hypothetical protein
VDIERSSTIFLHIPKTGGTTLRSILRHEYDVLCKENGLYNNESLEHYFENGDRQGDGQRKAVLGHMSYGAHRYLRGKAHYVTMLRDPISRIISYYYYLIERGGKSQEYIEKNDLDVADFVRDGLLWHKVQHTNNLQTRLLSGAGNTVPFGECREGMLDRAKKNVRERLVVVGLTNRFDDSVLLMRRKFGWGIPMYWYQNKTSERPKKECLSSGTIEMIEKYNELDLELYSFCKEHFQQEVASVDLSVDRQLLSLSNAIYGPLTNLYVHLRRGYNRITNRDSW